MNPNPESVRKAQEKRLIEQAQNKGIRITVKKEKGK